MAREFLERGDLDGPGCLVVDIRMPGENGLVLQQVLVHQSCAIPVIYITGNGDIPMAVLAMKRGAVDFLTKPFNDQELLDAFRGTELQRSTWIMRLYPYHVLLDTPGECQSRWL